MASYPYNVGFSIIDWSGSAGPFPDEPIFGMKLRFDYNCIYPGGMAGSFENSSWYAGPLIAFHSFTALPQISISGLPTYWASGSVWIDLDPWRGFPEVQEAHWLFADGTEFKVDFASLADISII